MASLSVILIVKNEALRLEACLRSVEWVDEIIVFDSGSTDRTVEIARAVTPHVFLTDWPGFGPQKNRALARVTADWVLSIDADERVSLQLRDEILQILRDSGQCVAYSLPRLSTYLGKTIRYGDWRGDRCIRLFRRGGARFSDDLIHERLIVGSGQIGRLSGPLYHDTFYSLSQVLNKVNDYSTLGAQQKMTEGKHASFAKAIGRGLWTFLRGYVLRAGFLDGREGFLLAVSNAEGVYYRYLKMLYDEKEGRLT